MNKSRLRKFRIMLEVVSEYKQNVIREIVAELVKNEGIKLPENKIIGWSYFKEFFELNDFEHFFLFGGELEGDKISRMKRLDAIMEEPSRVYFYKDMFEAMEDISMIEVSYTMNLSEIAMNELGNAYDCLAEIIEKDIYR